MRILHATDFSECADRALQEAVALARGLGAELVLLHVSVETPLYAEGILKMDDVRRVYGAQREWAAGALEAQAARLREAGLAVRTRLVVGVPSEEIVGRARAEGVDMIVMGTRGRGGVARFLLGSVADRVIRLASCPVLTVRAADGGG